MKKLSFLIAIAGLLISCDKTDSVDCNGLVCDASFKSLTVNFVNKDGIGVPVSNFSAINMRTKDTVYSKLSAMANTTPGTFIVIDDSYRPKLSAEGDDIKVTGTFDDTKQTKSTTLKIANPVCGCHFEKISGEQTVRFD
jgi:hypothetical protein